jgi:hypothetical protein
MAWVAMPKPENEESAKDIPSTEENLEAIGTGCFNYMTLSIFTLFNLAYVMEKLLTNICNGNTCYKHLLWEWQIRKELI